MILQLLSREGSLSCHVYCDRMNKLLNCWINRSTALYKIDRLEIQTGNAWKNELNRKTLEFISTRADNF